MDAADEPEDVLAVLAATTRRKILHALRRPADVAELSARMGITRQAVHEHLKTMQAAGLVAAECPPARRARVYCVNAAGVERLQARVGAFLTADGLPSPPLDRPTLKTVGDGNAATGEGLVLATPGGARWLPLADRSQWVLGRSGRCSLRLPYDPYMSNRHACLERRGAPGTWVLRDLGSTNGTMVNGHMVQGGRSAPLCPGDTVRMGLTTLWFHGE